MWNKNPKAFLSLLMALLIVGTANHCALEDLLGSISKVVFGTAGSREFSNHLESTTPHHHDDSPDPHEHGQPHAVTAVHLERVASDFLKLMTAIASICFVATLTFGYTISEFEPILKQRNEDPPGYSSELIFSLAQAPQAPPL